MSIEANASVVPFKYNGKVNELPSADLVRKLFFYNPETGKLIWKWYPHNKMGKARIGAVAGKISKGYVKIKISNIYYWAHRLAWLHYYGEPPNGLIDHMNAIKTDNRIVNLRVVDHKGNRMNRLEYRRMLALDVLRIFMCGTESPPPLL